jgi:hypothetical protein
MKTDLSRRIGRGIVPGMKRTARNFGRWAGLGLAVAVLGLPGSYLAWQAIKGRVLPAEVIVDIAPPFPPGHYLIAKVGNFNEAERISHRME